MNIIICDNNSSMCNELLSILSEFFITNNLTMPLFHTFADGETLLLSGIKPDIVFLDIQISGLSGIEIGKILHYKYCNSIIIVASSSMDYLDDAMRFNVFRYITKPIDKIRLFRNMQDAIAEYSRRHTTIYVKCGSDYYQCHRSFIINLKHVNSHNSHNIYLTNNLCADIAARKYTNFKAHYAAYINSDT